MPREQRDFNERTAALTLPLPGLYSAFFELGFSERHAEGLVDQEALLFKRGKLHSTAQEPNSSSNSFASFRSRVSNPSVNHP